MSINIDTKNINDLINIIYYQIDDNFVIKNNTIYENLKLCEDRLSKISNNKLIYICLYIIFLSKIKTIKSKNNNYKNTFLMINNDINNDVNNLYNFNEKIKKFIFDNGYKYNTVYNMLLNYYKKYEVLKYYPTSEIIKKLNDLNKIDYNLNNLYYSLNPTILYNKKENSFDIKNSINTYYYINNINNDIDKFKKSLIIVRGISGSGKTTFSNIFGDVSLSYDLYSEIEDGKYKKLTNNELDKAKKYNLLWVKNLMEQNVKKIFVNNQFLKYDNLKNYIELAKKYKYYVFVLILENINNTKNVHNVTNKEINKFKKIFEFKL